MSLLHIVTLFHFLVGIADGCKCYSPLGSFFYHAMQILQEVLQLGPEVA